MFEETTRPMKGVGLFLSYCGNKQLQNFSKLRNFASDSMQTTSRYPADWHGSTKLYWRWTTENIRRLNLYARFNSRAAQPVDIYFSFKLCFVRYCISWKCSDPKCFSQGTFTSSAVQTLASQPCNNWSLCWSNCRASHRYFLDVSSQ